MIIGVTGGIGSGKTFICNLLEVANLPVFSCDAAASFLINNDVDVKIAIKTLLGNDAYIGVEYFDEKGKVRPGEERLDKKYVASIIFENPDLRGKLNMIVHPAVKKAFDEWLLKQTSKVVIIESAILFESGFDKFVDKVLVVSAPMKTRIERLKKRDHLSEEEIQKRIGSQISDGEKLRKADFIITNGPRDDVNRQIFSFLNGIKEELY